MTLVGLALNYVVLSALCILLGYIFFPQDLELRNGFVVMAAVPVAVAVVPFTYLVKGDVEYSMTVTTLLYLLALILTPALIYVLFGSAINLWDLIILDLQLILLPLILSRILLLLRANKLPRWIYDVIINLALAVIVYAIIGVNQPTFFSGEGFLYPILAASLIRTFGIGLLTKKAMYKIGIEKTLIPPFTMLASIKNMALTSTLALSLFTPKSSLPAAICMPLEIFLFIYLKARA
jgi:BASS family bile acid:Na+ symporter